MDSLELLTHPVRLRIVHAMSGGRIHTTAQLSAMLPEVSKATVYRHVDLLASGGVLEVVDERRVRGAVERRYRLRRERASIDGTTVTPTDHRQIFVAAMATLLAEFDAYIADDRADPVDDLVGYRQHSLWLDPDELAQLITGLRAAIAPQFDNAATPGRSEYLLSPILFPLNRGPEAKA
ncbi:helix-turn-helix domain-containing protein [Nocardia sp. NPDC058519]|uniref:helix-turn-helix domain-containing protein n=1 Tax=Nocardia sp. NPDC058519 TaxID=3346535 RepID=UPI0036475B52